MTAKHSLCNNNIVKHNTNLALRDVIKFPQEIAYHIFIAPESLRPVSTTNK